MISRPPIRAAAAAVLGLCLGGLASAQCDEELVGQTPAILDDHFGESFDVDGKRAVVGAPRDGDAGLWAGAAHVFLKVQGQWTHEQKLVPTDLAPGGLFSHAQVALMDDWLFAGSTWEPTPDLNGDRGVVRVYRRDAAGWQPFQTLWHPGTGASAGYAGRIEADDGQLVVSARGMQRLFVYKYDGQKWVLSQSVGDPDPLCTGDWLGVDVSMAEGRIATSSVREIDGDGIAGNSEPKLVAYLFKRGFATVGPDDYGFEGRIDFQNSKAILPGALALGVDSVAVQGIVNAKDQSASLHVFDASSGSPTIAKLLPPDGLDVEFGRALAFADDDLLLVGSRGISPLGPIGKAVTFRRTGMGWYAESEFRPSDADADLRFATRVRGDDDHLFVGAQEHAAGGAISGRVQSFDALEKPSLQVDVDELSLTAGGVQTIELSICDSFAGRTYLVLGALTLPPGDAGLPLDDSHLQLVIDTWFVTTLAQANGGVFGATIGLLDAAGKATAQIAVPPGTDPALAGAELFHAAVILDAPGTGSTLATTVPSRLRLVP